MVDRVMSSDPNFARGWWSSGYSLDDALWLSAMITHRCQEGDLVPAPGEDAADLARLIGLGIFDNSDRPYDGATRAMRHSSSMVDRLWGLLREEIRRVCDGEVVQF